MPSESNGFCVFEAYRNQRTGLRTISGLPAGFRYGGKQPRLLNRRWSSRYFPYSTSSLLLLGILLAQDIVRIPQMLYAGYRSYAQSTEAVRCLCNLYTTHRLCISPTGRVHRVQMRWVAYRTYIGRTLAVRNRPLSRFRYVVTKPVRRDETGSVSAD